MDITADVAVRSRPRGERADAVLRVFSVHTCPRPDSDLAPQRGTAANTGQGPRAWS